LRHQLASGGAGINPTSKLMLTILAGVATWEREIMLERQREGIAKAKAAGKYKGRPISIDAGEIKRCQASWVLPQSPRSSVLREAASIACWGHTVPLSDRSACRPLGVMVSGGQINDPARCPV
jgi:hypothetical protein